MNKLTISDYLPISAKRICSIGNRWHHNFGDELILIGLMKLLISRFHSDKVPECYSNRYDRLLVSGWDLGFLKWFHRYFFSNEELDTIFYIQEIPHGFRSWWRFVRNSLSDLWKYLVCDVFIIWGGELFTEETPGSYFYRFRSLIPYWIRKLFVWNTKLYLMGGFQQPKSWYNRVIAWLIVRSANGCFMRDEESVEIINSKFKIQHWNKAKWFIDTSYFTIEKAKRQKGEKTKILENWEPRIENWKKHIIINSNPLSWKWTNELVGIANGYLDKWHYVYFLPAFFTSNPQQDDMKVYEYIKSNIVSEHNSNYKLLDRRNRHEFLIIFQSAENIFCSRLHVFLIASFLWLDVSAFPYQKKIAKNMSILKKCWILK